MDAFACKECVVCGVETDQRCSGCKEIRFCSVAHQKVLWPTHKYICGKPTITHPPLSWEELDCLAARVHEMDPRVQHLLSDFMCPEDRTISEYEAAKLLDPALQAIIRTSCYGTGYCYPADDVARYAFAQLATLESVARHLNGGTLPPRINSLFAHMLYAETFAALASFQLEEFPEGLKVCKSAEAEWARRRATKVREVLSTMKEELEPFYNNMEGTLMILEVHLGLRDEGEEEVRQKFAGGSQGASAAPTS